jgi:hypothetical protein
MAGESVARRIVFSAWADTNPKHPFDCHAALAQIKPLEGTPDMVLDHGDALTAVIVLEQPSGDDPALVQLLALRDYENRPINWGPGSLPEPITIGKDKYTADITHVAIWPDKIVAHDQYPNAPGLTRLHSYLRDRGNQRVTFRPLYDPDAAAELEDIKGLRRVEYGIHTPSKVLASTGSDFLGKLFPSAFGASVPSIKVSLGMSRKSPRDAYIDEDLSETVLKAVEQAEELFDTLVIAGTSKSQKTPSGNPKTVRVNLLNHRIQTTRDILRADAGGNLPNPEVVYETLIEARATIDKDGRLAKAVEGRTVLESLADED